MRTTLDIADDVLFAAKDLSKREHKSVGLVLSELARKGLNQPSSPLPSGIAEEFMGFRPLPSRGVVITSELINKLRDEEQI